MKKQFFFLVLIISLLSCSEEKTVATFSPKINKVAQRYQTLGRFSGTILIAQADESLFNQSYGFADYEKETPFSDSTIFKGSLIFNTRLAPRANQALYRMHRQLIIYLSANQ